MPTKVELDAAVSALRKAVEDRNTRGGHRSLMDEIREDARVAIEAAERVRTKRKRVPLSPEDINAIRDGWKCGMSVRAIARWIGRRPGVVSNKIMTMKLTLAPAELKQRLEAGGKEGARRKNKQRGKAPENMVPPRP